MKFWVVACTELHHCIGPLTSKSLATMVSIMLTERGGDNGCVYVPVRMEFLGQAVEVGSPEELELFSKSKSKKKEPYEGGQYL